MVYRFERYRWPDNFRALTVVKIKPHEGWPIYVNIRCPIITYPNAVNVTPAPRHAIRAAFMDARIKGMLLEDIEIEGWYTYEAALFGCWKVHIDHLWNETWEREMESQTVVPGWVDKPLSRLILPNVYVGVASDELMEDYFMPPSPKGPYSIDDMVPAMLDFLRYCERQGAEFEETMDMAEVEEPVIMLEVHGLDLPQIFADFPRTEQDWYKSRSIAAEPWAKLIGRLFLTESGNLIIDEWNDTPAREFGVSKPRAGYHRRT
jgi:hypothetical protein